MPYYKLVLDFLRKHQTGIVLGVAISLLLIKYVLPNFLYNIPMGYDAGMYRYLFLKYADSSSIFFFPELVGWEERQSPMLLWIIGRFIAMGMSVDWIITWGWSLTIIGVAVTYALYMYRIFDYRYGLVTAFGLISSYSFYELYSHMYWKSAIGLLCITAIIHLLSKRLYIAAAICIVLLAGIHHHSAFFIVVVAMVWWPLHAAFKQISFKKWVIYSIVLSAILLGSIIWYRHSLDFVWNQMYNVFTSFGIKSGAYPPVPTLVVHSLVLIVVSLVGFVQTYKKNACTVWHIAYAMSALLVFSQFYFYRRFYVIFDWIGIYFFTHGFLYLWYNYSIPVRAIVSVLLVCTLGINFKSVFNESFAITEREFRQIMLLESSIDLDSPVIVLDNISAFYVAGWLPNHTVYAPGLLNDPLTLQEWSELLLGNQEQRSAMLEKLPKNAVLLALPSFYRFYGPRSANFLADSCLQPVAGTPLITIQCL